MSFLIIILFLEIHWFCACLRLIWLIEEIIFYLSNKYNASLSGCCLSLL